MFPQLLWLFLRVFAELRRIWLPGPVLLVGSSAELAVGLLVPAVGREIVF